MKSLHVTVHFIPPWVETKSTPQKFRAYQVIHGAMSGRGVDPVCPSASTK